MKIEEQKITIREIVAGYKNNDEEGVIGYGGRLNIRPQYQREFVYKDKQKFAVMDTIWKGFPLNVMYWVRKDTDHYELLDGQQRTISFCSYVAGEYTMQFDDKLLGFHNLTPEQQNRILNYEIHIYICEGTDDEQLDWFQTINIAGERLTVQEIRNAIYSGTWLTAAKRYFSKTGCVAYKIGGDYMSGSPIRQEYLETVLGWINEGKVQEYMSAHQHDPNADELRQYFEHVMGWIQMKFPKKRKEMKGVPWGELYNQYKNKPLDATALEEQVSRLMRDSDVQNKKGIYAYVLDGDERHLNVRTFDANTRREVYERQEGICPICKQHFEIEEMEADHITPWSKGGRTIAANCQMLCQECNRRKSDK